MIKILIADDHPIVRRGLKEIVSEEAGMIVSGEAQNAKEVFELIRKQKWDVVVLDLTMPDKHGLEILKQLKKERPKLPVLVLTVHPEEQFAITVLKSGGDGFMNKETAPKELVKAIRKVATGGKYISPSFADELASYLGRGEKQLHENLSKREFQIMRMIALGKTIKEISDELFLSVKTISTYRVRILKKMRMKTNVQLARYAMKNKLA